MITSAPAWHASTASCSDVHSTSILVEKPHATRAFLTESVMLPVPMKKEETHYWAGPQTGWRSAGARLGAGGWGADGGGKR